MTPTLGGSKLIGFSIREHPISPLAWTMPPIAAEDLFLSVLKEHPKVLEEPEPVVRVQRLTDVAVEFAVRPWVKTADYWPVYWDVTREVKLRMANAGFRIPFPAAALRPVEPPRED